MRFFSLLAGRNQRVKRLLYMEDTGTSKVQGYFHIVFNMPISYVYTSLCRRFGYALLSNAALISVSKNSCQFLNHSEIKRKLHLATRGSDARCHIARNC